MYETFEEMRALQQLLDESAEAAGPHMRAIITADRRLRAEQLTERLQGMVLLVLATVSAHGRPLVGPVDGYFIHGSFYLASGRSSVRMRHLASRPSTSATCVASGELAVSVHGDAELFELSDPSRPELREAMLAHYLPLQGSTFEEWLNDEDPLAARIEAKKLFTFSGATH